MASTIQGYEGTGRSLSLKLISQIKEEARRTLKQIDLEQAIRYADNDPVELWLNKLLCLNATKESMILAEYPPVEDCELYLVNKDTLFAYKKQTEEFLNSIMSLFVSSHYKNTPNDLQLISDSTSHHIFILTQDVKKAGLQGLPEIYAAIQVAEEGGITKDIIEKNKESDNLPPGDLIPWTLSNYFLDNEFPKLTGIRIVRIATHPSAQRMGYGKRALDLLFNFYQGKLINLNKLEKNLGKEADSEQLKSGKAPLLSDLTEVKAPFVYYIGTSFGLTINLFKFWKKAEYVPLYLRTLQNSITGEHSCIMVRPIPLSTDEIHLNSNSTSIQSNNWIDSYSLDFSKRLISLLSYEFKKLRIDLAHEMLSPLADNSVVGSFYSKKQLDLFFSKEDFKRLQKYSQGLLNCNLILDLIPKVSEIFFLRKIAKSLSPEQSMILLGVGLQKKDFQQVESELDLIKKEKGANKPGRNNFSFGIDQNNIMGMFKKIIVKFADSLKKLLEEEIMTQEQLDPEVECTIKLNTDPSMAINPKEDMFQKESTIRKEEKEIRSGFYTEKFGSKKRKLSSENKN